LTGGGSLAFDRSMRSATWSLMIAIAVAACGKGGGGGGGGGGGAADPSAANAAVPAELKGKLEFVAARDERHGLAFVTPKGWQEGVVPGMVKPPEDANLGFMTKYSVGTNCDGDCEPKDWQAVTDKVDFAQLAGAGTVERDEKASGTRTMVVALGDRKELVMAWWKSGARHYVVCRVSMEKEIVAAAAAFEAACQATRPGW
jgi:hypothetical protein